jgi:hypothetical protein
MNGNGSLPLNLSFFCRSSSSSSVPVYLSLDQIEQGFVMKGFLQESDRSAARGHSLPRSLLLHIIAGLGMIDNRKKVINKQIKAIFDDNTYYSSIYGK